MINLITNKVRNFMIILAKLIDRATRSQVTPNFITLLSFLGHIWVFIALVDDRAILAAGLIVVFGLMDALDGALAKVQNKASATGMLLDATSDRAKEFLIYFGLIFAFADAENVAGVMATTAALGGSMMVSYIKAKGETALVSKKNIKEINRMFSGGLMQYQVRMTILVVGLVAGHPTITVTVIAALSWLTGLIRLIDISEALSAKSNKK